MSYGSAYATVKAALLDRLAERDALAEVPILPRRPLEASETTEAIWLGDASGAIGVTVFTAGRLQLDEDHELTVFVQVLGEDSDATQESMDARCDELLFEVLAAISNDATLGIETSPELPWVQAVPSGVRRIVGQVQNKTATFASLAELTINYRARIVAT